MSVLKILETGKAITSLTLQLAAQATQHSNIRFRSLVFFKFKKTFELKILDNHVY